MKQAPPDNFYRQVKRYLDQFEYIQHISDTAPFFPQHVHIEPTNLCNLRCIHCIQEQMKRTRGLMEWKVYKKVIDEIGPIGCAITLDVQGEPLLHPRIVDMVAYAKKSGCHVSLLTNGTRMTRALASDLIHLKLDRVVFSFEGISKTIYEKIRVRAKYDTVLRNILGFLKMNEQNGHYTHVCISAVMTDEFKKYAKRFEKNMYLLPVDKVFLNPLLTMLNEAGTAAQIDLKSLQKPLPQSKWPVCRVPWEDITVNWDGEVCLCPVDFDVRWSLGNVRNTSLRRMWNNKKSKAFRRAHLDRDYSQIEKNGTICSGCNCLWSDEYNILKDYKEYIVQAVVRQAKHYAGYLMKNNKDPRMQSSGKYRNLMNLIKKTEHKCE
ncbi:MAG: radical SAM protein [Candidatus Omnitrophica bacterium]|nr:radical SAM protein [Candidatus Omnitrophota bacterium]